MAVEVRSGANLIRFMVIPVLCVFFMVFFAISISNNGPVMVVPGARRPATAKPTKPSVPDKTAWYDDSKPRLQQFNFSASAQQSNQLCDSASPLFAKSSLHDPLWQMVIPNVFVYSAFVNDKHAPNRTVDIIAVLETANYTFVHAHTCVCRFLLVDTGEWISSEIYVRNEILDNHGTKYGDVRFLCNIPEKTTTTSVGIKCLSPTSCATVYLPVQHMPYKAPPKATFAVCGPVLFGTVFANRLIEYIEYYKLLGVEKIILYKHAVAQDVQLVLDHYRVEGTVDVHTWVIPGMDMREIWYYGQTAAINDCTERTGYKWDYTLVVDLDEFVVLSDGKPLSALALDSEDFCVVIRSTYVKVPPRRSPANASPGSLHRPPSVLLKNSMRSSHIFPWESRSKTLCHGRKVTAGGIHWPHFVLPDVRFHGRRTADPDKEAVLFHMRHDGNITWVNDDRGLVHVEKLAINMDRVIQRLLMRTKGDSKPVLRL